MIDFLQIGWLDCIKPFHWNMMTYVARPPKDLRISGPAYNTSLAIYFAGYVIFEVPSNVSSTSLITPLLKAHRSCEHRSRQYSRLGALPLFARILSPIRLDCSALYFVSHFLDPFINEYTESFTSSWGYRNRL